MKRVQDRNDEARTQMSVKDGRTVSGLYDGTIEGANGSTAGIQLIFCGFRCHQIL